MEIVITTLKVLAMFCLACVVVLIFICLACGVSFIVNEIGEYLKKRKATNIIHFDRDSPSSMIYKYSIKKEFVRSAELCANACLKKYGYIYYSSIYELLHLQWDPKSKNTCISNTDNIKLHYEPNGLIHIIAEDKKNE